PGAPESFRFTTLQKRYSLPPIVAPSPGQYHSSDLSGFSTAVTSFPLLLQKKCNGLLSPSSCQATVLLTIRLSTRLPFSMRPIHVSPKSHMVRFSFRRMLVAPSPPVQPDVCVNFCVRAGNGLADSTSNGGSTGFWTRSIGSKMRQTHICHSTEDEVRR